VYAYGGMNAAPPRSPSVELDLDSQSITRFAGTGSYGDALGSGATAELVLPRALIVTGGRLVLADSRNHRIVFLRDASIPSVRR